MELDSFKILIIDDSRLHREVLKSILLSDTTGLPAVPGRSYELLEASSGLEALELVITTIPDLILLDIILPGMDGFEVLSVLKNTEATKAIPVIIVTGLRNIEDEEKGLAIGAEDYITKPYHKTLVIARIKIQLRILEQIRIIEELSLSDALTGLPNRRSFDQRIALEWRHAVREKSTINILMADIDYFKKLNDTYGHQQGDVALETVAETIRQSAKRAGDYASRWGGEEFAVLLPNTSPSGARQIAERIRQNVATTPIPNIGGGDPIFVTISLGVSSIVPTTSDSIAEFINVADKALYTAKSTGRNRVS